MGNKTENASIKCRRCGVELNEENSWERADGVSCYCVDCEEQFYKEFAQDAGFSLALYFMCLKFDVPCMPMLLPEDFNKQTFESKDTRWQWYLSALDESGNYLQKNGEISRFSNGVTDMLRIFGKDFTERDFGAYVRHEKERVARLPGTQIQRDRWGWDEQYTSAEYDELDRMYFNWRASFKGVQITPQMDDTLISVTKFKRTRDMLVRKGSYKEAKAIQAMIDQMLASENMRKKDERPVEDMRMDAMVSYFEKAGIMKHGEFMSYEDTARALAKFAQRPSKYDYTLDACDVFMLDFINTMRANNGLPPVSEIDAKYAVNDDNHEFADTPNEQEIANMKYANIGKVTRVGGSAKKKTTTKGGKK